MKVQEPSAYARVMLTDGEAAEALGLSRSAFRKYVLPSMKVVFIGSLVRVPVRELERWTDDHSRVWTREGMA